MPYTIKYNILEGEVFMAKIIEFSKGDGKISKRISDVRCVYNVGEVNGEKYVSLSTFGSETREDKEKASQVLHIDKKTAKEIVDILSSEFDL